MEMIIVLPDGETWSVLDGCKILVLTNEEMKSVLADTVSLCCIVPTVEVDLSKLITNLKDAL